MHTTTTFRNTRNFLSILLAKLSTILRCNITVNWKSESFLEIIVSFSFNDRQLCIIAKFKNCFRNKSRIILQDQLEKSVIHGDLNEQNILVRPVPGDEEQNFEIFR